MSLSFFVLIFIWVHLIRYNICMIHIGDVLNILSDKTTYSRHIKKNLTNLIKVKFLSEH